MTKIRVLHVVHDFLFGGIEAFLYYLSQAQLNNESLEVEILCCQSEDKILNKRIAKSGVVVHYIRITAYRFYMTEVSPSTFTSLFGNGQYAAGKSEYSEFIDRYGRLEGLFPADVGFASIYLFFGAAGLLLFLTLLFRVWRIKVIKEFKYAKYYISFLFLGNIAGSPLLGSIPMLCIALYILTKGNRLLNNGVK